MSKTGKIIIVAVLIALVSIVIAMKQRNGTEAEPSSEKTAAAKTNQNSEQTHSEQTQTTQKNQDAEKLPHLVDLGAGKCIPCKMMKPILDDLKKNYNDQFKLTFIDVWDNPEKKKKYEIKVIPTQIFYDSDGEELFRHEGFYSKEDILSKWEELGIEIQKER
ncbi:Thioredoxin [Sedimentisphaera cyanobacteriorum]|uniref:Thioredoxin n=1 Tax=Sedimentisphaera cyanobacteriorum TaxID=1940790 RepID=A0A1Q2HRX7_9BACT|nr:thioredoxin family protein [Sedimentisphaera cyanobacteriorum]AQQ10182.1 Thioredoxin [Sedimentisphaera cyanobacteriorum]